MIRPLHDAWFDKRRPTVNCATPGQRDQALRQRRSEDYGRLSGCAPPELIRQAEEIPSHIKAIQEF